MTVSEVTAQLIKVTYEDGRSYTYGLKDKKPYCQVGQPFKAFQSILAGIIERSVDPICSATAWSPKTGARSENPIERYCAVKALGYLREQGIVELLLEIAQRDEDRRIALEAAAALSRLSDSRGRTLLREAYISAVNDEAWRMEIVLILSELEQEWTSEELLSIARKDSSSEIVAASVWGLAFCHSPSPLEVLKFLSHESDNVVAHAIVALSQSLKSDDLDSVVDALDKDDRVAAAAAEVLARSRDELIPSLLRLTFDSSRSEKGRQWLRIILGRRNEEFCRAAASNLGISLEQLSTIEPFWRGLSGNWTSREDFRARLGLLAFQNISNRS